MNIVLVGFMGTGKSATGRVLADRLSWPFFDTDEMIEREAGMSISDIFARDGESCFRDLETSAVRLLSMMDNIVISCGGGVVLRAENMDALRTNGVIVCLTASPETIFKRVSKTVNRPLLKVQDPLRRIKELQEQRAPYYRDCHITIDTSSLSPKSVADHILNNSLVVNKIIKGVH